MPRGAWLCELRSSALCRCCHQAAHRMLQCWTCAVPGSAITLRVTSWDASLVGYLVAASSRPGCMLSPLLPGHLSRAASQLPHAAHTSCMQHIHFACLRECLGRPCSSIGFVRHPVCCHKCIRQLEQQHYPAGLGVCCSPLGLVLLCSWAGSLMCAGTGRGPACI